jgi:peptidoglycan/LPS O-acetylase OafA/YrhL
MLDQDLHITNVWLMKLGYSSIDILIFAIFAMLLTPGRHSALLAPAFSKQWLRWLGRYSYSIYVFHWIILQVLVFKLESILGANDRLGPSAYYIARIGGILLTLTVSYYSYHYFESKFLALKKYFSSDVKWRWSFKRIYFFRATAKQAQS